MTIQPELKEQLIGRAREIAAERGWALLEPIEVTDSNEGGEAVWMVHSNFMMRGRNARIVLRKSDHSLVRASYLPR